MADDIPKKVNIELLDFKLDQLHQKIDDMDKHLDSKFVKSTHYVVLKNEVDLLKKIVFGGICLILVSFLTALIYQVMPKKGVYKNANNSKVYWSNSLHRVDFPHRRCKIY